MREREQVITEYDVRLSNLDHPNQKAEYAMDLARHFSTVACVFDGEDSAGRQKLRLMTPEECASRASDISEAMYSAFEKRGWLMKLATGAEIEKRQAELKADKRNNNS